MNISNLIDNNKKFLSLLKKNPLIINEKYDNKKLIYYLIIKDKKELLDEIFNINKNSFLEKDERNLMFPHIALNLNLYNMFFYLCDKILTFNNNFFNHEIRNKYKLLDLIIEKNDLNLLDNFVEKYNYYLEWNDDEYSYLLKLVIKYINEIDKLLPLIKKIIKSDKINLKNFFELPKNNNALFIIIYHYLKPHVFNLKKKISFKEIKEFINLYKEQINFENQKNIPLFYYAGQYNNLLLLKFCYINNANFNHYTQFGNNNFCHHIMLNSQNKTINYVLNLNIDFNFLNSNNETPIYSLLNNNNNIKINLIKKLLLKTKNWNNQNIYGFTIIHKLCSKPYIEKFYSILKTRYIDLNLKNIFKQNILDILYFTFDKKLKYKDSKIKIQNFKKNIILKKFIEKLSAESNEINKLCINKLNNSCINKAMQLILATNMTDENNNDKLYNNIIINDYPFANFNLFYGRDIDIYIYIKILLDTYPELGIARDISFNLNKAIKSMKGINNEFCLSLIKKTLQLNNLYNLNIYWLADKIHIPYNFHSAIINSIKNYNKKYIICRINLIDEVNHENMLLIDTKLKRIIRFEPQGGISFEKTIKFDSFLSNYFSKILFFKQYKYYKPNDYLPINGLQSLSHELDSDYIRKGDINGFCVAWSLWFIEFYITNESLITKEKNFKNIFFKFIKKIIFKGELLINYIRNYANYLHNKMIFLLSKIIAYDNLFYDKYLDKDLDMLYKYVNNEFSK